MHPRGHPFRVLDRWDENDLSVARLFYLGRNADTAESLQLTKLDAGVYVGSMPAAELSDVEAVQRVPTQFSGHRE